MGIVDFLKRFFGKKEEKVVSKPKGEKKADYGRLVQILKAKLPKSAFKSKKQFQEYIKKLAKKEGDKALKKALQKIARSKRLAESLYQQMKK